MDRSYPSRPVLGVGAIILDRDRVLLVKRGREPRKGLWSIPGGALELGESLTEGVRREVREETALDVRVLGLVEVFEWVERDGEGRIRYHYVVTDYHCESLGGSPRADDDASDVRWVKRSALADLPLTTGASAVIEKTFRLRDGQ